MPFFHCNDQLAIRMIVRACIDPESNLFHFPADYVLFQIGTWDEIKGRISPKKANINIGVALELRVNIPQANAAYLTLVNGPQDEETTDVENAK